MDSETFKTFSEWPQAGRSVSAGQKAKFYLVDPVTGSRVAVFSEDQTEPLTTRECEGWVLTPVEELEPAGKRKPGTKGFIKVSAPRGRGTAIWCGNDKEIIKLLKRKGYGYDMKLHRWLKKDADPESVADIMEKINYTVEREFAESVPSI